MMKKIPVMVGIVIVQLVAAYFIMDYIVNKPAVVEEEVIIQYVTYDFGNITVNPSNSKGRHFFIVDISFSYDALIDSIPYLIENNKLFLTDTLNTMMMDKDLKVLSTPAGRESLRVDIDGIFEKVTRRDINKVLFKKYLIQ